MRAVSKAVNNEASSVFQLAGIWSQAGCTGGSPMPSSLAERHGMILTSSQTLAMRSPVSTHANIATSTFETYSCFKHFLLLFKSRSWVFVKKIEYFSSETLIKLQISIDRVLLENNCPS